MNGTLGCNTLAKSRQMAPALKLEQRQMTRRQLHIRECLNGTCRRRRREIDDDQMMTRRQLPIRECLNGSCRCGAVFCVCTPERPNACIVHIHNTMRAALTTKSSG
eukprot:scaffold121951_cov17-Tisochrysis_lutea.AAC.1